MNKISNTMRLIMTSLCVLSVALAMTLMTSQSTRILNPRIPSGRFAIGTKEDPQARIRHDWMRLHDPATGEVPVNIRQKELSYARSAAMSDEIAGRLRKGASKAKSVLVTWTARGPYNVGGRTRALGIDKRNAAIILAGGVSGGMWRTTTGGVSWTRVNALDEIQSATCIVQDTRSGKEDTWYYGTGELIGNSTARFQIYRGDGIYKSTDNGVMWSKLASTATNIPQSFDHKFDYVWNVGVDVSNAAQDEVYAAGFGGIYRSTDGGMSWSLAVGSFGNSSSRNTDVAVTSTGVVYATLGTNTNTQGVTSPEAGIWRSTDGVTWTNIKPSTYPATVTRVVIGIAPSNENVAYFLAETNGFGFSTNYAGNLDYTSFWKYTYASGVGNGNGTEGNGGTWENRSSNMPNFGGNVGSFANQGGYDLVVQVKPDAENTVFIGGTNLYRSTDGFATTTNTTWIGGYSVANNVSIYPNHHPDLHAIAFNPSSSSVMFTGDDGGIHRTDNNLAGSGTNGGLSWTSLNNGYQTTQFYSLAIDYARSGNVNIVGGMQDNGTWFTNSPSALVPWTDLLGGDGAFSSVAASGSSYYVSSQNATIYRLIVNETIGDYTDFAKVTPVGLTTPQFINPFILDPNNNAIMYLVDGNVLWRNNDLTGIPLASQVGGSANDATSVNWDKLTSTQITGTFTALGVSKASPANRVYAGSSNGQVYRIDNAHSGQPALTDVYTSKGFPAGFVSCIAVDPSNGDRSMVVFSNYGVKSLFYTTDAGGSWANIGGAPIEQLTDGTGNGPSCRWAVILPGSPTTYVVGTSTGVYTTTSLNGTSTVWTQEGASVIGNAVVDMIVARESDRLVAVATHGNGIYTANITTSVEEIDGVAPTQFVLQQNYPNPFNPTTNIRYSITERGHVRLNVYDATGKQVASLVDREQPAGTYEALWDSRTMGSATASSGVYFARLEHGNRISTQKMVLVK